MSDTPADEQRMAEEEAVHPRVFEAMQEYTAAIDAGKRPNRQELLKKYADVAEELSAYLHGVAFLDSAVEQIKGDVGVKSTGQERSSGGLIGFGEPLGDFQLVREIGRGGMGVVYEAVQLSLGRKVAVKVLPLAASLDGRHLQRFRNEAQAAAQLHHTNIVPVYAVGCERSVHYYAMQLIEGRSLAEVIRMLRREDSARRTKGAAFLSSGDKTIRVDNSEDMESLPSIFRHAEEAEQAMPPAVGDLSAMRESKRVNYYRLIAQFGVQTASALDYAHQVGVVHRDIKPGNLMLDGRGVVWVTDFGLAQMYAGNAQGKGGEGGMTQVGDLMGTFRYMSPEQASGKAVVLDQRTDIYSLGVTLYELLTLEHAVRGETREEMLRRISQVDPWPMRSLDKRIPVELETIVGKAMAKEPGERYQSAKALSEDLARFLKDEPIKARPPSLWDKGIRWMRRNKQWTLAAGVVLFLETILLSTTTLYIGREQEHTAEAYAAERKVAQQELKERQQAQRNFEQARQAMDFMTRIADEQMPRDPRLASLRRTILERALQYYEQVLADQKGQKGAAQLTRDESRVAELLSELGTAEELNRVNFSLWLLAQWSVRQELKITSQQQAAISGYMLAASRSMRMPLGRATGVAATTEPSAEMLTADLNQRAQALKDTLTAAQFERLQQISRQWRGVAAFSDEDVRAQLALTMAQQEAIQKIRSALENTEHGVGLGGPGPFGNASRSPLERTAVNKAVELLSDQQAAVWKGLIGERFIAPTDEGWDRGGGGGGGPSGWRFGGPPR
jgi:serine/threonine protein kinase